MVNLSFVRGPSTKFSFFNFSNISTYQISGSLGIEIRNYLLFSHYFHRIAIVFWLHPATLLSSSLGYGSCSGHLWSSKKLSDPYGIFFSPVFQSIVTGSLAKTFLSSSVFLLVAKVPVKEKILGFIPTGAHYGRFWYILFENRVMAWTA